MNKKLTAMRNDVANVKIKAFEIPAFENWLKIDASDGTGINPMQYTTNLGDYCMQIGQIVSRLSNNTDTFAIAITCGSNAKSAMNKIFYSYITVEKTKDGLDELKKWYESDTAAANRAFQNYLQKNYFIDEKQQKNEMDNVR